MTKANDGKSGLEPWLPVKGGDSFFGLDRSKPVLNRDIKKDSIFVRIKMAWDIIRHNY